jgi:hypothetical protein
LDALVQKHTRYTPLNVDLTLVREAGEILGTEGTTDTIHAALLEVVNRYKRQQLLEYDFPGLTPESLKTARGAGDSGPVEDLPPG